MSDVLNPADYGFSATDEYTQSIVNGFMKIPSNQFYTHLKFLSPYFPLEITSITIDYVGDHFMPYRGSYQWDVKPDVVIAMLSAANGDKFDSPTFQIGKLKWI